MNKNINLKLLFIVALVAVALWKLYPTFQVTLMSVEARRAMEQEKPEAFKGAIKLGLDLQGGIRLVFQLDQSRLTEDQKKDAISRALEVISNRVDQFGISEPVIQRQGDDRIIIELPGFHNVERAKKLVGSTALLEFNLVREADDMSLALDALDRYLKNKNRQQKNDDSAAALTSPAATTKDEKTMQDKDSAKSTENLFGEVVSTDTAAKGDSLSDEEKAAAAYEKELQADKPFTALLIKAGYDVAVLQGNIAKVTAILNDAVAQSSLPKGVKFVWSAEKEGEPGNEYRRIFLVKSSPEITGNYLEDAKPSISQGGLEAGKAVVNMTLNGEGARRFAKITNANIDKRLAIVLDGQVFSAPSIRTKIPNGRAEITGMKDYNEARDLAIVLRAGALPAPLLIIEERVVGPTLGRDSIQMSVYAFAVASILVILYMLFLYKGTGTIAILALLLNVLFLLSILAGMGLTLTLPGIAGIILTMGMAVDANVLINERIKEELRNGKTVRAAIEAGYARAFSAIFDSNITTLITAIILHYYGTGPIKGFAITLIVGLICSMFTAIWVTHQVFNKLTSSTNIQKLSI
ncbi:MAG: protein-export membrane protein SecD [Elusimicrobia bacterium RIFOXYB2_FULL_49_7]|nr:MAG: protein-export membrane protein SecD [Elusimicrobia bacterium RIFOXYB2_FULL_49_7]